MSAFLGDVNSGNGVRKLKSRKLGEAWPDWRACERKDMRYNPGSASISTVYEILWIKCEQEMRSKRNSLHLARLLGEKKKNNCSWWNLLGVVNWLLGQKLLWEHCMAKTKCVPFHFTLWMACLLKEQSFLSQRFLKTLLEVIITWKILFWFCCLSWLNSLLGYLTCFQILSRSHSFASCVLLAIWAFIHSLNR